MRYNFNLSKLSTGNIIAFFISILLGLSSITDNSLFMFGVVLFIPIGLINPVYIIPVYFISSLSSQYFMVSQGLGISRLCSIAIFVGVFIRILFGKNSIEKHWIWYLIYIGIVTLISFVFSNHKYINSVYIVSLNLLVVFSFANIKLNLRQLNDLLKSIYISVILISISIIINVIINPVQLLGRLTIANDVNSNTFSIIVAQLCAFLFGYILCYKGKINKIICIILGFSNVCLVLLSGSRTSFIAIVVGVLLTILVVKYKNNEKLRGTLIVGIFIIIIGVIFLNVIEQYPILANRFSMQNIMHTNGAGRLDRIIAEVKYVIPKNLLFGVGTSTLNETISLQGYIIYPGSSHNIIFSMLTQIGICGFIGYVLFVKSIIKRLIKNINMYKICSIPLCLILCCICNGIGEVVYSSRFFYSTLALGVLCIISLKSAEYDVNMDNI